MKPEYFRNDDTYKKIDNIGRAGIVSMFIGVSVVTIILIYFTTSRTFQIVLLLCWLFSVVFGFAVIKWMIYNKTLPNEVPLAVIIADDKIILRFKNKEIFICHCEVKEFYIDKVGKIFNITFYLKNEKLLYIRVSEKIADAIIKWYKRNLIFSYKRSPTDDLTKYNF